jgi:hypothetical protein
MGELDIEALSWWNAAHVRRRDRVVDRSGGAAESLRGAAGALN